MPDSAHHAESRGADARRPPSAASPEALEQDLANILAQQQAGLSPWLADDSPLAGIAREFFANNWAQFCANLLRRTRLLRVVPEPSPAPMQFFFELDRPFKRKGPDDAQVQWQAGPIRGMICYRPNLFVEPAGAHVAVQIDPALAFFHPNCARRRGSVICLGELPSSPFPLPLDLLVENHIYPIVTYQNMTPSHPLDREAALYFAFAPDAMEGLEPVPPLY